MPINSKQKGKRGELNLVHFLNDKFGIIAERTQQYKGGQNSADIAILKPSLPFYVEVKYRERLSIHEAYEQVLNDSKGSQKIPIVAHRKKRTEWLVTLSAEDFFRIFL